MKYFVHCGSEEHGGELFGPYDTPHEAAVAVGDMVLGAFQRDRHAIGARSYTVIEARNKPAAEKIVKNAADLGMGLDAWGFDSDGNRREYL